MTRLRNPPKELLGDRIERLLKTIKADKVAELYEKVGKRPCGCAKRKDALNKWHVRMLAAIEAYKKEEAEQEADDHG